MIIVLALDFFSNLQPLFGPMAPPCNNPTCRLLQVHGGVEGPPRRRRRTEGARLRPRAQPRELSARVCRLLPPALAGVLQALEDHCHLDL